ncbi:hypothetical protein PGT21_018790 [Puccinia graminis f. sp. tritici]|uniref:Uncharacterized protein n=1 Tax=Puccinia graminis f. sp. tritici TaxID=56615 RepID=A0A5B0QTE7_PUCGR|nr:hypothetical protein PGT21_018790 [Puccinia graminis f. sp. tritici]
MPKMGPVQVPFRGLAHLKLSRRSLTTSTPPNRKLVSTGDTLHLPTRRLISTVNNLRHAQNQPDNQVSNNGSRELHKKAQDSEVVPQMVNFGQTHVEDLHKRLEELHGPVENSEDFLQTADHEVFRTYVEGLEELKHTLETLTDGRASTPGFRFKEVWTQLLNREYSFRDITVACNIEKYPDLHEKASRLAFLLQHPMLSQDSKINHDRRVAALDAPSLNDANTLFDQPAHPLQGKIVEKGFNREYINTKGIVDPTLKTLTEFAAKWTPKTYLAPYTSLIATSMTGKSRLLKELSRHICVVYVCVRPEYSQGYPPRSEYASSVLLDSKRTNLQTQYERLLLAILDAVADYFFAKESGTRQQRLDQWIAHSFPQSNQSGDPPFWSNVRTKMDKISKSPPLTSTKKAVQLKKALMRMKDSTNFIEQNNLRLLLAIDEASELLARSPSRDSSFFDIFRGALERIPSNSSGFFSVLADTDSRVSNFQPQSLKIGEKIPKKLFNPIYQIKTFDVNVMDPPADWHQLQSAFRLLSYGSPFWRVYADEGKETGLTDRDIIKGLSEHALQKLLSMDGKPDTLTNAQAMALLGSTIQPRLNRASDLEAKLVSSHASTCMNISTPQLILTSQYPSQFTLSSAANQYLASDEASLIRCIQVLTSLNRQSLIGPGDVGELVSRIILLRAMQKTMQKTQPAADTETHSENIMMPFGHSVRLVDFLQTLTGWNENDLKLGSIDKENQEELLTRGQLFWNHFISIDHTPTSAGLLRKLYRGLAVHCKPNQAWFDQLFTIYLQSSPTEALDERNVTFCGIQVKNLKQNDNIKEQASKWTPKDAKMKLQGRNPYLVLYFCLNDFRPKKPRSHPKKLKSTSSATSITLETPTPLPKITHVPDGQLSKEEARRRASLAFYGLDAFPFLSEKLVAALKELLDSDPPVLQLPENPSELDCEYVYGASPEVFSLDKAD